MRLKNKNNQNQNWPIIFGLWLIYFCFGYSVSSIAPIVPYITQDLNITYKQMGLILGAWQFTYIFFALPAGFILEIWLKSINIYSSNNHYIITYIKRTI